MSHRLRTRSNLTHSIWSAPWGVWAISLAVLAVVAACGAAEDTAAIDSPIEPVPAAAPQEASAAVGEIITYVGTGSPQFAGDGGPAGAAGMYAPSGVAIDRDGNLFIAADKRVRRVDAATGIITTIAGRGTSRNLGDGGPALEAGFRETRGVAVDGAGNVFIADNGSGRVRRIDAVTGIVTTAAGGGAGDPRAKIFGDGGPATEALVKQPDDVAVDANGNLYIATDNRIRKVDAASGKIDTIAGTGERGVEGDGGPATSAYFAEPVSVAVDEQGNMFIADKENHRIRKVDASSGIMTTVAGFGKHYERTAMSYRGNVGNNYDYSASATSGAGYSGDGGPAVEAMLSLPSGITLAPDGSLYIADGNVRVRKIAAGTGIITTVAADEYESTQDSGKVAVHTDVIGQIVSIVINSQGELFLADSKKNLVHRVATSPAQ